MFLVELGWKLVKWYQETHHQLKWLKPAILGLKMDFDSVVKGQLMFSMEHDHVFNVAAEN